MESILHCSSLIETEAEWMKVRTVSRASDEDLFCVNSCEVSPIVPAVSFHTRSLPLHCLSSKQEVDVSYAGSERGQEKVAEEMTLQNKQHYRIKKQFMTSLIQGNLTPVFHELHISTGNA